MIPTAIKKATSQRRTNTTLIEIQPTWLPNYTLCNTTWKVFFGQMALSSPGGTNPYRLSSYSLQVPSFELAILVKKGTRWDRKFGPCDLSHKFKLAWIRGILRLVLKILRVNRVNSCVRSRRKRGRGGERAKARIERGGLGVRRTPAMRTTCDWPL